MEYILSHNEQTCYRTLAKHNGLGMAELSKLTGIHRPNLYKVIADLLTQNLVNRTARGKRTVYTISTQQDLERKIQSSVQMAQSEGSSLLNEVFDASRMFRIKNGHDITNMYQELVDSLGQQEPYYAFSSASSYKIAEKYFPSNFRRVRGEKELWSYVITTAPLDPKKPRFSLDIKSFIGKGVPTECLWMAYGDKFAFVDFTSETGYIITDKRLSLFQQSILKNIFGAI